MSIKRSLKILLILTSMITVILISFLAHRMLTNKIVDLQTQNLKSIAETNGKGLEAMLDTQITEISLLSLQHELQQLVIQSNNGLDISPETVNQFLLERKQSYLYCKRISLYNARKDVIACSDAYIIGKDTPSDLTLTYLSATKDIALGVGGVTPIKEDDKTNFTFDIGYPMVDSDSDHIIGYIINTLQVSYFDKFLNSISMGDTGFGILLDKEGTILYHPNLSLVGNHIESERLSNLVSNYNKGLALPSGCFELTQNDIKKAYGYKVIPELNWVLIVKQDVKEIQSFTEIMLSLLFFICAILLTLIILFANVLAKKYTEPIIALRDAMRTAADGNLTVQSNIKAKNEIGELSKNFNKMLHIINTNYEDLASMHEELLSNEEQLRSNYDHIEFLAYHDTLTGLPNKLAFLDYVNTVLASSDINSKTHAVYFVDLDNFKTVNDTLGHEFGDSLLMRTAQRLTSILGENGMLARAGGDEFLIFKENIASKKEAEDFASKIINVFRSPFDLDGEIVYVSMSIGIAIYPENGITSNTLIKNADIAMYKSKDTGKNKFTLFDSKMEEELNRNTLIVEVLRNAIINNEIYIQYQPLLNLETNEIAGYEALMRIQNDKLGSLAPSEFIPIAEETGLIIELSSWLLREVCYYHKSLIEQGITNCTVSVNISSVQINQPGFINLLSDILEETALPPSYLELEITESTLVSSIMDTNTLLTSLQELGVKISLDDFGTGYSSLNYLIKLPINTLKIDKSFIDNICYSAKDSYIAETIIQLAHKLHIRVVAEGVEHQDQLNLLKIKKCDIIQGFLFSAPLHPPALVDVIQETI